MLENKLIFFFISCFFKIDASEFFSKRCENNCIFTEEFLNSKTIKAFPSSCSTVCADIKIDQNTDLSEEQLTEAFKTMKVLYGTLQVSNTNYTSGKFFKSLEVMECEGIGGFTWSHNGEMTEMGLSNLITCFCDIEIYSNSKMIRLNMPKLKNFSSSNSTIRQVEMIISNLSPEFCITIQEMQVFISSKNLYMSRMPDKYCNFTTYFDSGVKHCFHNYTFKTLSLPSEYTPSNGLKTNNFKNLESDCDTICGVVLIEGGDEEMVHKLDKLQILYGMLLIRVTELTAVDFLSNLEYVASLEADQPAVYLKSNKNLNHIAIPRLKNVRAGKKEWISIGMNSDNLTTSINEPTICSPYKDVLGDVELYSAEINLSTCGLCIQNK